MSKQTGGLSAEFIARQRARLQALRQELVGGEVGTLDEERAAGELHGDEPHEYEEGAQDLAQKEIDQSLNDVNDQRIGDIVRALQKIDEGTYGLSDESGDPIPQARLEVMPEAILTVAEQERREAGA
ncbi:DnaK suppressor protein [Paraburkholderia sp. GAS199]|uniref:TraR/DksA family transcriptional regulator n=1 Tax=Paraburkholderia sp. GAS199 TaxID=3035126 RepID=UPI003D1F6C4A